MTYEKKLREYKSEINKHKNSPIKMSFEVLTMNDEQVCSLCKQYEGVKLDVLEAEVGVNHPPFHKKCRCIVTFTVEGAR